MDVLGALGVAVAIWLAFRFAETVSNTVTAPRFLVRAGTLAAERGQNLIEFALLTPAVLVFIAAIVIFGLALNTRSSLQQAVREGARQASVGATLAEVQSLAAGNAPDTLTPTEIQWCHPAGPTGTHGRVGDPVQIYIIDSGDGLKGHPFPLVPTNGIFASFGLSDVTVRLSPVATARLEKSVPSEDVDTTCT